MLVGYKVRIDFDDGSDETLDEVFSSEEEAEAAAQQWASDYSQGGDYLKEAGEEYCKQEVIGWDIYEE